MSTTIQRARTFLTAVLPLPNAVDPDSETAVNSQAFEEPVARVSSQTSARGSKVEPLSAGRSRPSTMTELSQDSTGPVQTVRSVVTVFFDDNAGVGSNHLGTGSADSYLSTSPSVHSRVSARWSSSPVRRSITARSPMPGAPQEDELRVGRYLLFFSQFLHNSPDGEGFVVDVEMEEKFARQRYLHFRTAFMSGALIMGIGAVFMAVNAFIQQNLERAVIMLVGVFPIYVVIGLWVLKRKSQYLKASSTSRERVLTGLLALQSFIIVAAEWVRPAIDYGTLVMHMGFIFNFSPLSFGAMLSVTVVFGMAPYALLLLLYIMVDFSYGKLVWGLAAWYTEVKQGCLSAQSSVHFEVQQRIIVPTFITILQVLVTRRRDESLRVDALTKENLRMQKRLLDGEKRRNEGLLRSMLPWKIIEALKVNEPINAQLFDDVTVVFIEICNFHQICHELEPDDVMEVLNVIYHEFDRLSDILAVYKVETVMQVYMAVVGCPEPVVNHADVAAHFALAAQRSMSHLRHRIDRHVRAAAVHQFTATGHGGSLDLAIRVGLNSGPLRAGVVGMESPRYKLVGDTVNTASRMESTCERGKVQVSKSTEQRLSHGMFVLEDRGEISVKGKGTMHTAYLLGYSGDDGTYDRHRVLIERQRKPHVSLEALATPNAAGCSVGLGGFLTPQGRHPRRDLDERSMSFCSSLSGGSGLTQVKSLDEETDNVELIRSMSMTSRDMSVTSREKELIRDMSVTSREKELSLSSSGSPRSRLKEFVVKVPARSHHHPLPQPVVEEAPMPPLPSAHQDAPEGPCKDLEMLELEPQTSIHSEPVQSGAQELAGPPVMPLSPLERKINSPPQRSAALGLFTPPGRAVEKVAESGLVNIVSLALGREADAADHLHLPLHYYSRATLFGATSKLRKCWEWLDLLFLLVPPSQKTESWMEELDRDRPEYFSHVMPSRISLARKITTYLLLIFVVMSILDQWVWFDMAGDQATLRWLLFVRNVANNLVAIAYLVIMSSNFASSTRCIQYLTLAMAIVQCIGLMVCCIGFYRNEPVTVATVVSFCAVSLFYTVCTLLQRLVICTFAISVYIVARAVACTNSSGSHAVVDSVINIGFLVVFVGFMACGVRLQEHLAHAAHYEQRRAKQRLQRIRQAKAAGTHLLNNLLPNHVISLVCEGVSPIAENHQEITIIFTDIKGFTAFASRISPYELFTVLNSMFSAFDEIIFNWGLYKVEIIGDAYFISAGCPAVSEDPIEPTEYAMRAVEVGLALQRSLPSVCDDPNVKMRVGLHTGKVVAGVVGKKGPRYHLFGSAVGYAEKMESNGIPGRVQISDATHDMLIRAGHSYDFEERSLDIEGEEGVQTTWLVNKSMSNQAVQIKLQLAQMRHKAMTKTRATDCSGERSIS